MISDMPQDDDDDYPCEEFEDLPPARRGLLDIHQWSGLGAALNPPLVYGFGTATEKQKRAALNTLHRGGDHLNRNYFMGRDCHELWKGGRLIGLCCIFISKSLSEKHPSLHTTLTAIFILKKYRGNGYASLFIDSIWRDLGASFTVEISRAASLGAKEIDVFLNADLESFQGEGVLNHLSNCFEIWIAGARLAFGIKINFTVDAGF